MGRTGGLLHSADRPVEDAVGEAEPTDNPEPGWTDSRLFPRHERSGLEQSGKAMNIEDFRAYCLAKPNTTEGAPFGADALVFKVSGKMFALASLDEVPPRVNLKCDPERTLDLRDRYEEVTPGYHMNKKHWNTIELSGGVPELELRGMIDHSYDLVVAGLPKKRRK